jgi:hypothetical protein
MVFNMSSWLGILIPLQIIWFVILTVVTVRMVRHYTRLTGQSTKTGLKEILDSILEMQSRIQKEYVNHGKEIEELQRTGIHHVQRLGIVRFNPFSDTGGSQSFTFAMLDGNNNGIVMTSLYARTGNRWYIKKVHEGIGVGVELSREEQEAIRIARRSERNV